MVSCHCEERSDEAIQGMALAAPGLLRFARNDSLRPPLQPANHFVELIQRLVADAQLAALAAMFDRDRKAERIGEPFL